MPTSLTLDIPKESDQHRQLVEAISQRMDLAKSGQQGRHDAWKKAEDAVLAYIPESETDSRRRLQREQQGKPTYTTIRLPYSYAILLSAHTYWTSVFFGRNPVHQFAGRHGESEQQTQSIEALIGYQVDTGGAMAPYYLWVYDAGKYGVGILGTYWEREIIRYTQIAGEPDPITGKITKMESTVEIPGYEGSRVYNVNPFDFFPDPRVTVWEFQKGEFCGVRKRMGWNEVIKRQRAGYFMNVDKLPENTGRGMQFQSGSQLVRPSDKSWALASEKGKHPSWLTCFEVYVNLIPKDWGLGSGDYPVQWVFTILDDYSLIIGATPLGMAHGQFPFDVLPGEVEAYGSWTRGLPETVEGLQNTMDWLLNTHFFNTRAALNNQFLVDPTKVVIKDMQSGTPGGIWRIRPEAYGLDINTFVKQFQVQDVTAQHVSDIGLMQGVGERMIGVNDQMMGAFTNQSNRKTATEVRTSTGFGVNRQKTSTEFMSHVGFVPHSRKLVQMSQQLYDQPKQLRIVGDLAQLYGPGFMMVTPESIAGFYDYVCVDGTAPIDRGAQVNMWVQIMSAMQQYPQILMEYDISRIFGHVAVLGGVRNLQQFKMTPEAMQRQLLSQQLQVSVAPDEQLSNEASKGNVVPLRPNPPLPAADTRTGGASTNGMMGGY